MLTTVTLNPCIDLTVQVEQLHAGRLNTAQEMRSDVGGKGINVAVVFRALNLPVTCCGIGADTKRLTSFLAEKGISHRFIPTDGEMRTNIKIVDAAGSFTEINGVGQTVPESALEECLRLIEELAGHSRLVTMGGRLPPGAPVDFYRQAVEAVRRTEALAVVDAEGEPLRQAIKAGPHLIKPNIHELRGTFGVEAASVPEVVAVCRNIVKSGVEMVCVSLGKEGAVLVNADEAWYSPALGITPQGIQGAGDSMVAGMCATLLAGGNLSQMLSFGQAAAAASLMRPGTLLCRKQDFAQLLPKVKCERIE